MHITYISSYVPRKCGIATYTRDLAEESEKSGNEISVVAMENLVIPNTYSKPVARTISQHNKSDYTRAAASINKSSTEIVHLQHEFGLFGGEGGNYILLLAKKLIKPLTVTFHTVLLTPSETQKKIIQELSRLSRRIIVMDEIGKERLVSVYGLNLEDITVIVHGAPIIDKADAQGSKKSIGYPDKFILLANNLLSRNKGIEYGIEAVSKAVKKIPNLLFLVVGETHPLVKTEEGESYREELAEQVKNLGIEENVVFRNEYVSKEELKTILSAADIYITPYLDPQQITSGTLSYAIGAGKACIATEYIYAKQILKNSKGVLVPFRDSDSIAAALIELFENPQKKLAIETRVGLLSQEMSWFKVAEKHHEVYKKIALAENDVHIRTADFIDSPADIDYLVHLTNKIGVVQHANKLFPDLRHGYSTCDNARALIVASHMYKKYGNGEFANLIKVYADFLKLAQEQDGKFHTFLNAKKKWDDQAGVTDGYARAVWGLGFHLYKNPEHSSFKEVRNLFEKAMEQMPNIIDLRTAAYSILGLYYYIKAVKNEKIAVRLATKHLKKLAEFLKKAYDENKQQDWNWFEEVVTYDNFRLPQSLFAVYLITKQEIFKEIAKDSLKFITACNYDEENDYYDFIGQDGWHSKTGKKAEYDQQPLEAAGVVDANIFANQALKESKYVEEANRAFEWFFGNNRNHRSVYDSTSKGVADGLTLRGVNANQGAESIICFLISSLALSESNEALIFKSKKPNVVTAEIKYSTPAAHTIK